jgi:hypothetical protein
MRIAIFVTELVAQHNGMVSRMTSMHGSGVMQKRQASPPLPESGPPATFEKPDADAEDHTHTIPPRSKPRESKGQPHGQDLIHLERPAVRHRAEL